ncbi:hypothetical protein N9933_03715 [bacterium]|nr:hypothetical protein [bacterium]
MVYFIELIKGIFISLGIMVGFIVPITYFIIKSKTKYDPTELLIAFQNYLKYLKSNEEFEDISLVTKIITQLELYKVIEEVSQFNIKQDIALNLKDEYGSTTLRVVITYIILNKKQ